MLRFLISNQHERQHVEHLAGPIEFGRGPERDGITRCVLPDPFVSRDHVRIEEQPDGRIRVENLSARYPICVLADNSLLAPGQVSFFNAPVRLSIGETLLDIEINVATPALEAGPASGVGLGAGDDFDLALGDEYMAEKEGMGTVAPFRPEAEPADSLMEAMPIEAMPVEAVPLEAEPWPPAADTTKTQAPPPVAEPAAPSAPPPAPPKVEVPPPPRPPLRTRGGSMKPASTKVDALPPPPSAPVPSPAAPAPAVVPPPPPEMPAVAIDHVHFSVTAPTVMVPGGSYVLDVWAHQEEQRNEVLVRAREAQGGKDFRMKSKGAVGVARGTILRVQLAMPGFIIEDAEDFLAWQGTISNATFLVQVPQKMHLGSYPGTVSFYTGGLRIARLHFTVVVGPRETPPAALPAREHWLRTAFASYASPDRDAVLARVQGIQKALPSLDIFLDVASLRSGQRWQEQLHEAVTKRDIFYLFWSQHARDSRWVDWEWRTALATRGIEFIDPVPLASPEEVLPPRELAELHFFDSWLAFLRHRGAVTREERTERGAPAGAEPRLLVLRGQRRKVEYPIYEGLNFIGRAGEKPVDIDLEDQEPPDRTWCSQQHALVRLEEGRLFLEDLNSANGTYLNRNRIYPGQKQPLKANDVIQIGTVQMKVMV